MCFNDIVARVADLRWKNRVFDGECLQVVEYRIAGQFQMPVFNLEPGIAGAGKFYFWAAENLLNLFPVRKQITSL